MLVELSVESERKRTAFTLVELLVVIGIIALLVGMLLPVLNKARGAANTVKCLSNLRQIGQAFDMYLSNYKGTIVQPVEYDANYTPTTTVMWFQRLSIYLNSKDVRGGTADVSTTSAVLRGCPDWIGIDSTGTGRWTATRSVTACHASCVRRNPPRGIIFHTAQAFL